MEQKLINFKELLKFGEEGEKAIAEYFIEHNKIVSPLYQYGLNTAPCAFAIDSKIVLPDLLVFYYGNSNFVECKRKQRWITYKYGLETGMDRRLYNNYMLLNKESNIPLYFVFIHEEKEPIGVYYVNSNIKPHRIWDGINSSNGKRIEEEMVLWSFDQLKLFKNYNQILEKLKCSQSG